MIGSERAKQNHPHRWTRAGATSVALLLLVGAAGCGEDFTVVPVRNLERPSDLAFACLGVFGSGDAMTVTGRPMAWCHSPDQPDPRADLSNRVEGTFGLATNTARGELAAIDFDLADYRISPLLDLDARNPGYNQLPVGALPEVISVSDDSCRAVTANRGSCDLSLVDLPRLLAPQFPVRAPSSGAGPIVTHLRFRTASAELRASPFEIAFLPTGAAVGSQLEAQANPAPACRADGVPTAAGVVPWRALVTFPSCDLVALVEMPVAGGEGRWFGQIVSSVRILADGTVIDQGNNPVCPADCGSAQPAGPDAGAGAGDAGAGPTGTSLGVGALAIMPDGTRAYVGAAGSPVITALGIGLAGIEKLPDDRRVPLAENAGGVTRLRLSLNPYGPPRLPNGRFVGGRGMFLYAFARDGSVRVVDVGLPSGGRERECDVNVEPNSLLGLDSPCFPVSEGKPRRLLSDGPGLRIPAPQPMVAPPVPVDIAFAQVGNQAIGFLISSTGQIYHVAVDGEGGTQQSAIPELTTLPHNFRRLGASQGNLAGGSAYVAGEPDRQFTPEQIPFPSRIAFTSRLDGPRLETFVTATASSARYVQFPRPYAAAPEQFGINWEGTVPGTERQGARIEPAGTNLMTLTDPGADFCRAGVEEGDVLALLGCDQDEQCNRDRRGLQVCHRAAPGAQGICLPRDFVADEERMRLCRSELSSRRRFAVREVFRGRLALGLRPDEVPQPRLYPCQDDSICQPDTAHQPNASTGDPGFRCVTTTAGGGPRCLKPCGERAQDGSWQLSDRLCRPGHVCADVGDATLGPLCVEAPAVRSECLPHLLSYRVQAGHSYILSSNVLPNLGSRKEEPSTDPWGGRCVPDPARNPSYGQRISLSAPHCKNIVDGPDAIAGKVIPLTPESDLGGWGNACLFRGPNEDAGGSQEHVKALFENPTVRFVFTNLEQYVGDAASVFVAIEGGFAPLEVRASRLTVDFRLGARIVTGPMDSAQTLGDATEGAPPPYLFVVDQGRTSTSLSRGQILRVNPRPAQLYPGGFIDSPDFDSLFPIQ